MPSSPVLTDLDEFKLLLGISGTDEDDLLSMLLVRQEKAVLKYLGRDIVSTDYTEYYSGHCRPDLVLRQRPVTAITGVWVDHYGAFGHGSGAFADTTRWDIGNQFAPRPLEENEANPSMLMALCGVWPRGEGNIKVSYTAGYTVIPEDLAGAVMDLARIVYQSSQDGGNLKSETHSRHTWEVFTPDELMKGDARLTSAVQLLSAYMEVSI